MIPNGDRRSPQRREMDDLKASILKRYSSMDPVEDRSLIQQARKLIQETATKLGIDVPKQVQPDDETKVIEKPA
jgi:hypothetical protein